MKQTNSIRTESAIGLAIFCLLLIPYGISKITKSNASYIWYDQTPEHDGGDTLAIGELSRLVEKNFPDRQYYEAVAYTDEGMRYYANYNKKFQALLITGDPQSGWSCFYYATPHQLKMVAERRLSCDSLRFYLKPFPQGLLGECPTRSRDLFQFF
jgi:hypothetical protein